MASVRFFSRIAILLLSCGYFSGCAVIDNFDDRAEIYNRSSSRYANVAEFLNLIRASRFEPLNFVTFSSATGHNTLTGSMGIPSVTFGPGQVAAQHQYTFGPNSATRMAQNDFILTNVDDPGSYAALMAPINPAVIAFFIEQGYPRQLLFFLFFDHLTVSDGGSSTEYDLNDPGKESYALFGGRMADMLVSGLTAQIDATAVPSASAIPPFKFCFDPQLPNLYESKKRDVMTPVCQSQTWQKITAKSSPVASYTFLNVTKHQTIKVFLRSTYGIYAHLGRIISKGGNITNILDAADSDDPNLFTVTNEAGNCFVEADYSGAHYCVPEGANNTKRIFALLRQLVGLKISPANPTPTQTVRAL